jgi:hypothetical protein
VIIAQLDATRATLADMSQRATIAGVALPEAKVTLALRISEGVDCGLEMATASSLNSVARLAASLRETLRELEAVIPAAQADDAFSRLAAEILGEE